MTEAFPLPDLQDDTAAGPDLGLDATFGEMELAAKGKPEGQFGTTVEPAVPPDWALTASLAEALLARTRDLRVMAFLTVARLHVAGLPGFAAGLALLRQTLDTLWDPVHPLLDPEDDNDPMPRANALLALQNPVSVLRPLRELPLASLPRIRPVTYRDLAVLNGAMEPEPGRERLSEAEIVDTFVKTDQAALSATAAALEGAVADVAGIGAAFDRQAGPGNGPTLDNLVKLLREILKDLTRFRTLAAAAAAAATDDPAADADADAEGTPDADTGNGPDAPAGEPGSPAPRARAPAAIRSVVALHNRNDALHALELAAAYFRLHEPSSPLPLLIDRARRLAPLPFMDILRDMAPDGLLQAHAVAGTPPE